MKTDFVNKESLCILAFLVNNKAYLREIAEKIRLSASTVHKRLVPLQRRSIVKSFRKKNRKFFEVNYDSPLARNIITMLVISDLTATRGFLALVRLDIRGVYLFGSAASGRLSAGSDIDLAVYFNSKPDASLVNKIKRDLGNKLKREIQFVSLSDEKLSSMEKENTELLNQIRHKSIVMWGEEL